MVHLYAEYDLVGFEVCHLGFPSIIDVNNE